MVEWVVEMIVPLTKIESSLEQRSHHKYNKKELGKSIQILHQLSFFLKNHFSDFF